MRSEEQKDGGLSGIRGEVGEQERIDAIQSVAGEAQNQRKRSSKIEVPDNPEPFRLHKSEQCNITPKSARKAIKNGKTRRASGTSACSVPGESLEAAASGLVSVLKAGVTGLQATRKTGRLRRIRLR